VIGAELLNLPRTEKQAERNAGGLASADPKCAAVSSLRGDQLLLLASALSRKPYPRDSAVIAAGDPTDALLHRDFRPAESRDERQRGTRGRFSRSWTGAISSARWD